MIKELDKFLKGVEINKIKISVPDGIKYISDWPGFDYPKGHCIIDKTICGCGFTEWCLRNGKPTILCSPRKVLLKNKEIQHNYMTDEETGELVLNPEPEFPVYYFRNEGEGQVNYDSSGDSSDSKISDKMTPQEKQEYLKSIKTAMLDWITNYSVKCQIKYHRVPNPKILVTYDSIGHVIDALGEDIYKFNLVVDEFQSIFSDASFKSDTELNFVSTLKSYPNLDVLYVSATPMIDRYLGVIDYFPYLPFYELDWGDRVEKVAIDWTWTKSLISSCVNLINDYKAGLFPIKVLENQEIAESHEVVFYVNSVKTICDIIKKAGLTADECNIVCADMPQNLKRIKKLGKGFDYGRIPTKDEISKNKMFTFCTRTAYLGADFYSTNAYTVVCSDLNIKTLNVDISLDLPQIAGRQRMEENAWKNEIKFLYMSKNKDDDITIEEFMENDRKKDEETNGLLSTATSDNLWVKKGSRDREMYEHDYVGFDKNGNPEYNYLVRISCMRGYEISRKDYILNSVSRRKDVPDKLSFSESKSINEVEDEYIKSFRSEFEKDSNFERRMKLVCDIIKEDQHKYSLIKNIVPITYRNYINMLGPDIIKSRSYKESEIREAFSYISYSDQLRTSILAKFPVGSKLSLKMIKSTLEEIYKDLDIRKTPKASDLEEYFELRSCLVRSDDGKRDRAYEIIKKK